jgi:hypothetical protein
MRPSQIIGGALPSLTRVGSHIYNSAAVTTVTFAGVSFSTVGRRHLYFEFGTLGPAATGVTIGGVTATQVVTVSNGTTRAYGYIASVPTGTSGNVVVTFGSATTNVFGVLYALYNLNSATPFDTATGTATSANITTDLDTKNRGVIIGLVASTGGSGSGVTGLDNWTQINASPRMVDASRLATSDETPRSITWTGYSSGVIAGVCASFR